MRVSIVLRAVIVAAGGFVLLLVVLKSAVALERGISSQSAPKQRESLEGSLIQMTEGISVPFHVNAALPLLEGGAAVDVFGIGMCMLGDTVTLTFTLTQSSLVGAAGLWQDTCTGTLQSWSQDISVSASQAFRPGAAETCTLTVTRDGDGNITAIDEWCRRVFLSTYRNFLPLQQPPRDETLPLEVGL